ncbi:MAG: hypothetical protein ACLQDM_22175 [Bradyrhizobium sp.]
MQLNVDPRIRLIDPSGVTGCKSEVVMAELAEAGTFETPGIEPLAADAAARFTRANKNALEFMFGAQKMLFEEAVFASSEMLERARTETHLFSEFVSKIAGSHSVKDLRAMFRECSQHQIDFVRRDSERLFKHGERMIEATAKLLADRPRPGAVF